MCNRRLSDGTVVAGTLVLTTGAREVKLPPGSYFEFTGKAPHMTRREAGPDCILAIDILAGHFDPGIALLTVDNLSCSRGPRRLFGGVSFAAAPGEWIRVVGPNGSGKTTLLRALAGLTRPDAGSIDWSGAAPLSESRAWLGHAAGWKDTLTVSENLRLAWALDGELAAAEADVANEALRRAGLERQRNLAIARLSQGQKKRLHLARLTRSTRPLWLLDEPTAALDDAGAQMFCELVSKHLANGGIAVVATHLPLGITAVRAHDVAIPA